MLEMNSFARVVMTTAGNLEEAGRVGQTLVEERLAACATVVPAVESIYCWKGKIERSSEALLLLKTGAEQIEALEARLQQLHSYETPEFLVLPVEAGSRGYLEWMRGGLGVGK